MLEALPTIFDMDIGSDPDDTYVALMVLHDMQRFSPALLLTNDETEFFGRASFLATLVAATHVNVQVAAGRPSVRRRSTCLVEEAQLVNTRVSFERNGVDALLRTLEMHSRVRYFGLGALTNLDAALSLRPDLASRIELVQMGPALKGAYRRDVPQYNARLDPGAFVRVLHRVQHPKLVFSHSTWGGHKDSTQQRLGIYPEDPLAAALRNASAASALYVRHLEAWTKTGKDCSIMHDPTTVLSVLEPGFVDFADVTLAIDDDGWAMLDKPSHELLRAWLPERGRVIAEYLSGPPKESDKQTIRCAISLDVDDHAARRAITKAVFRDLGVVIAEQWGAWRR